MTAPLIAPLIPPRARPGTREQGRTAAVRRRPVAAVPEVPAAPDGVLYGFGRPGDLGRPVGPSGEIVPASTQGFAAEHVLNK